MNKAELIIRVSEKADVTQKIAKVIVDTLFDGMRESLEKGERIEIRGFGSFVVRDYGGYKGRNPKTGQIVEVAPKKLPFFKVGKELKEMVNVGSIAPKVKAAALSSADPVSPIPPLKPDDEGSLQGGNP